MGGTDHVFVSGEGSAPQPVFGKNPSFASGNSPIHLLHIEEEQPGIDQGRCGEQETIQAI
jgi:hypothetical protein